MSNMYMPDDIVNLIIMWKDVKDTREAAFKITKHMREMRDDYENKYAIVMGLRADLDVEWEDDGIEDEEDPNTLVLEKLNKAIEVVEEAAKIRSTLQQDVRDSIDRYIKAKKLVA